MLANGAGILISQTLRTFLESFLRLVSWQCIGAVLRLKRAKWTTLALSYFAYVAFANFFRLSAINSQLTRESKTVWSIARWFFSKTLHLSAIRKQVLSHIS